MQVSVHSPLLLLFFREHGLLRWWMQQIFMRTVPRVTSLRTGHAWRCEASVHCAEHYWTSFIIVGVNVGVALRRVELTPTVMNEALQCSTEDTIRIYSCPFMLYCGGPSGLCQTSLLVFFHRPSPEPLEFPWRVIDPAVKKFHSATGRLADPTVDRLLL